ncbi:reverse transcriptase domain-containing protein [Tanacetum coccineum]|uniref:Reverse transcriptase domain-containing protein n=1 Tax=Tanacetum coccineum TaxID=301880 RepID=A0ABQ5H1S4_9ASTR
MLQRCEDTNLCLNWEKSHFMVKEGIVLGHKISKKGIEVDKAKVDVIAKLPHPTTVKGVRSFLGHAGFYRRFIKDFSKISRPMTHLLEKNTLFIFSDECIQAFQTLKKKLTEAPILIAPDWDLPFVYFAKKLLTSSQLAIVGHGGHYVPKLHIQKRFHGAVPIFTREQIHTPWPFATRQNGLKRKRSPPTTPELFANFLNLSSPDSVAPVLFISDSRIHFCNDRLQRTMGENRASWSDKLDDAIWAFHTAYKTPIGCTPYKLVYGKACHLLIELEDKAYWALKHANFDLETAGGSPVKFNSMN